MKKTTTATEQTMTDRNVTDRNAALALATRHAECIIPQTIYMDGRPNEWADGGKLNDAFRAAVNEMYDYEVPVNSDPSDSPVKWVEDFTVYFNGMVERGRSVT